MESNQDFHWHLVFAGGWIFKVAEDAVVFIGAHEYVQLVKRRDIAKDTRMYCCYYF